MPTVACPNCHRHDLESSVLASDCCLYCHNPWPEAFVDSVIQSDPFYAVLDPESDRAKLRHDWPDVPDYVPCENCAEQMIFGAHACQTCGCTFDLDFWIEWAADHPYDFHGNPMINDDEWLDDLDESLPTDLGFNTSDWFSWRETLCCNQDPADCECDFPFAWGEGYEAAKIYDDTKGDVYWKGQKSACSACIHYFTPNCLPLRAWVRAEDRLQDIGAIDVCGNFVHFEVLAAAKRRWEEYVSGPPVGLTPVDDSEWDDDEVDPDDGLPYQTIRDMNMSIKNITDRMSK
jgi:hypothetical protein